MIVYADRARTEEAGSALERVRQEARAAGTDHDEVVSLLVAVGELQVAAEDALCPRHDDLAPAAGPLRAAARAAGRALAASWDADLPSVARHLDGLRGCLAQARAEAWPSPLCLRVAEGFAYYALSPETYLEVARGLAAETACADVVCVGVRSIGAPLAAVAAAAFSERGRPVQVATVRPRGHPWDRRLSLSPELAAQLGPRPGRLWLVVDEGPGISGSSLAAVTEALAGLGVPAGRVVLLVSHAPDPSGLRSERGRRAVAEHRLLAPDWEAAWVSPGARLAEAFGGGGLKDGSAGRWRAWTSWEHRPVPAVQPQHERRKYRLAAGEGEALLRFAGLGAHGRSTRDRARVLAEAGLGPPARRLARGFLETGLVPGRPLARGEGREPAVIEAVARQVAFDATRFGTGHAVEKEPLLQMLRVNAEEALGPWTLRDWLRWQARASSLPSVEAVAVDGRMLPHEWLVTPGGLLKTDGVDHHADHFLPGCTDPAWDVAGAAVEMALPAGAARALASRVAELARDATLSARLPFYTACYLAFRAGYAAMAAEALAGTDDGRRFAFLGRRYRAGLRARLRG